MTYLMGVPQSIRDDNVTAPLPEFEGDPFRTAAFAMRTKLSHFIATIDSGKLNNAADIADFDAILDTVSMMQPYTARMGG
jgi:hypothetical protein